MTARKLTKEQQVKADAEKVETQASAAAKTGELQTANTSGEAEPKTEQDAQAAAAAAQEQALQTPQEPDGTPKNLDGTPKRTTARRARRAGAATADEVAAAEKEHGKGVDHAADVLGVYSSEVLEVDGDVATTTDGHKYRLTGDARGDFVWLTEPKPAPAL